jgi:hypothetical protein
VECLVTAEQINPSGTPPEPFPKGSDRTVSEPFAKPPGVGEGEGAGATSVVGSVGEPSPFCSRHPNDTEKDCFACGQARRTFPDRKAKWDSEQREAAALARQAAITACRLCDEFGEITFDDSVRKCDHNHREVSA